jgi:hypothetical protein
MECLCPIVLLFMLLTVGYHQLFGPFFNKLFGLEEWDAEEYDDEDDDAFTEEEPDWEDPDEEVAESKREPVDVRALLDSSLPPDQYVVFHDVSFATAPGREGVKKLQVDHVVVAATGLYCIRVLKLDGQIDAAAERVFDWIHWPVGKRMKHIPNPVGEISATARRLARRLGLQPRQVVGIVALAGSGVLDGVESPSGVYYASDLPATFERRWKERLTPSEIAEVTKRLGAGLN